MDTDSLIVSIKRSHLRRHCKYVETKCDTSNFGLETSLPKGKNKTVIGLMDDGLGGKIIKALAVLLY